jgi:excisionase family DNA binding protein
MNIGYTTKQASEILGVSQSRIRQLVLANEIDHLYFGRVLVITEKGLKEARKRKTKPGPAIEKRRLKAA